MAEPQPKRTFAGKTTVSGDRLNMRLPGKAAKALGRGKGTTFLVYVEDGRLIFEIAGDE